MDNSAFPLVSVIIPVFNHEDYVKQALNSVLDQTYPNLELIIIDDGSRDNSCTVIEQTLLERKEKPNSQRRIQFLRQENQGAHATINRGLSLAEGEWLTILNSDDYYGLKRIETLVTKTKATNSELAFTYVAGINEHNHSLPAEHWWPIWYERVRCNLFLNVPTVGFALLRDNFAVSTGNLFFSRSLREKVGFFKDLKLMHDWDFLLRALSFAEPLLIREPLYFYRLHNHNTQTQVHHLFDDERQEVYREYLCAVVPSPPLNPRAPCHWYWPSEFGKWRTTLRMERGLSCYLKEAATKKHNDHAHEKAIPEKVLTPIPHSNKKPITLVSHDLSLTGAPKVVADLAVSLSANGYAPQIIALADGPMRGELEKKGIPVHTVNRSFRLVECLSLLSTLCFRIKGPIVANSTLSWVLVLPVTLMRPWKKAIWYIHESFTPLGSTHGIRGKILTLLLKMSLKLSPPRLWFGSKSSQETWEGVGFTQSKVMYWSGIPQTEVAPELHQASTPLKHLLAVGTPSIRKGTHILIQAFLKCLKEKQIPEDTELTIIGFTGAHQIHFIPISDSIIEAVNSPYRENFHFINAVKPDGLAPYYSSSDLFIQPSLQECLPLALLTAMSKAMPIITTDVDGCIEAITPHETGYVCPPFDVDALAQAITEAVNHPEQSRRYGRQAQAVFNRKFALEITEKDVLSELQK